jgi:hypothetical protein
VRIEDELRQLQTAPRAEAWEKFQAARAAAGNPVAEAAAPSRPVRRLVPYWAWAAAGVALVAAVVGLWVPNARQAVPRGTESAGAELHTAPLGDPASKQQEGPLPKVAVAAVQASSYLRKASLGAKKQPQAEEVVPVAAGDPKNTFASAGTRAEAQSPVEALFSRPEALSVPSAPNTSPRVYLAEVGAQTASSKPFEAPKAQKASWPTSSWFQFEVALDNGNLYDLNDLRRTVSPKSGHWKQSALAFAQKQWENLLRGERPAASWTLPEELTVTIDLKNAAQRLPANPFNRNHSPKNNP